MRAANLRAVETLITRSAPDEVVVPQGYVAAPYSSKLRSDAPRLRNKPFLHRSLA